MRLSAQVCFVTLASLAVSSAMSVFGLAEQGEGGSAYTTQM